LGESWSNLNSLFLERNSFSGALPTELGLLTNLKNVLINYNNFSGTLPTELVELTNLQTFSMDNNRLVGSTNETFCSNDYLNSLSILQADCLPNGDGSVEMECSCCTACCTSDGSYCQEF
jgi:hypothetical protein